MANIRPKKREAFRVRVNDKDVPQHLYERTGSHIQMARAIIETCSLHDGQRIRIASLHSGRVKEYVVQGGAPVLDRDA